MAASYRKAAALTAAGLFATGVLCGCTSNGKAKAHAQVHHISSSRAREYASIAELCDDSVLVVEGAVAKQDVHDPDPNATNPDPRTQSTVTVTEVLKGASAQSTIIVVQNQTPTWVNDEGPPTLSVNANYLLFLVRTDLPDADPDAADYYVTGSAGISTASTRAALRGKIRSR